MNQAIAIFDIGKTNKKLILFDRSYQVLFEQEVRIPEAIDDDGDPCEDIVALSRWMKESLEAVIRSDKWRVIAVNCTAYGATFVNLDQAGKTLGSLYNYLKPYPRTLLERFYQDYGPREQISAASASPPMGMLNSGLQLYWLKHQKPELFKRIQWSLHLPQYCSYLFTGIPLAEMTSIGCHTYLWDFSTSGYQSWAQKEGLVSLFPRIERSDHTNASRFGGDFLHCGIGIHDSSAALVPYLISCDDPFALISTGTWSITLKSI